LSGSLGRSAMPERVPGATAVAAQVGVPSPVWLM
jgi:hypothetical protein